MVKTDNVATSDFLTQKKLTRDDGKQDKLAKFD